MSAVIAQILSRKFLNQFVNGAGLDSALTTFDTYLAAVTGLRMKAIRQFSVHMSADLSSDSVSITGSVLTDNYVDFISGGWLPGQVVALYDTDLGYSYDEYTILSVTETTITFTASLEHSGTSGDMVIYLASELLGCRYRSNLIENTEAFNYVSKVDGNDRGYSFDMTTVQYNAGTEVAGTALGVAKSWQMESDEVTIKCTQVAGSGNGFVAIFEIAEIFTVLPLFDDLSQIEDGDIPDYFAGAKCLRHVCRADFLMSPADPYTTFTFTDSANPATNGNTGYFDETFNGITPDSFSVDSVEYESGGISVDEIQLDAETEFTITLTGIFAAGATKAMVQIFAINESLDDTLTVDENLLFDTLITTEGAAAAAGDNGIFSDVQAAISGSDLVITGKINFTSDQQEIGSGLTFVLTTATALTGVTWTASKPINLICDLGAFASDSDSSGLISITDCGFLEHPFEYDDEDNLRTNYAGWIEDGVLMKLEFYTELSLGALMNDMTVRLVAYNSTTDEHFDLYVKPFDLSGYPVTSGGVQEINIDTTQGFKLASGDQFNWVKLDKGTLVGTKQYYTLYLGVKMDWRDWVSNPDADAVFYDNTKPQNNLNYKVSNYSGLNDYSIKAFFDFTMLDADEAETVYRFRSPDIEIYNYDEDENTTPLWTGVISTEGETTGADLSQNLADDENTLFTAVFTPTSGLITTSAIWGVLRIEKYQNGGLFGIYELSTMRDYLAGQPVIPLSGETYCKMTITSGDVTLEGRIDYTQLDPAFQYKLSARIGSSCDDVKEASATDTERFGVSNVAFVDVTTPDGGTVTNIPVASATMSALVAALTSGSGSDYIFDDVTTSSMSVTAPYAGASYNGDIITVVTKNAIGIVLVTKVFTLAGGIDGVDCPPYIPDVNNYKETEAGEIKYTEGSEVKLIE